MNVGELKAFLDEENFDDSAEVAAILGGYGGHLELAYRMIDFEDEGLEHPSPVPYPTLIFGPQPYINPRFQNPDGTHRTVEEVVALCYGDSGAASMLLQELALCGLIDPEHDLMKPVETD